MAERPMSLASRIVTLVMVVLLFAGVTAFAWLDRGWEGAIGMWIPFLLMFGPVIVAVRFGWRSLGKRPDGTRSWAARLVFLPYLLTTRLAFELLTKFSREKPLAVVVPNLAFGRRLTEREARQSGFVSVLDLTSEFTEVPAFRSLSGFRSLPVFDYTAPTPEQLRFAVAWIAEAVARGPVYVHCALGHGRSACVVLAYLLTTGKVASVAEGLKLLRKERPKVNLHASQRDVLRPLEVTPLRI